MYAQFPRITVRLNHLWLAGEIVIVTVFYIALSYERLKVGAELHSVRRFNVDHLHLPTEPFILQQRVHDDQRVESSRRRRKWKTQPIPSARKRRAVPGTPSSKNV